MFPNIFKLYKSVWKSMIQPHRIEYGEDNLGPAVGEYNGQFYVKENHTIRNLKGQAIKVTLYLPANREELMKENQNREENFMEQTGSANAEVDAQGNVLHPNPEETNHQPKIETPEVGKTYEGMDCVVFLHTHSGTRLQGLFLREWLILRKKALCVFDFHGSGLSEGKYVSFGYYETFDLDAVVRFLLEQKKMRSIALWGRSMGAATAIMYLSDSFRKEMARLVTLNIERRDIFYPKDKVMCCVLDSPFPSLIDSIKNLVDKKSKYVPGILVSLALKIIDSKR